MNKSSSPMVVGLVLVIVRLHSTLRPVPWSGVKALVWGLAVVLLVGTAVATVRTARRLRAVGGEAAARDAYTLTFGGLLLVALALSLPDVLGR